MRGPLEGVRVLDLSRLFPGPFATLLLSDLGADVVKIEDGQGGDYARYYPPLLPDGNSAAFHALNRGKRSVAIDLKSDAGRAELLHLVKRADVLVESFRPGVLERMALSPEVLQAQNPRLVVCRISGYGQAGLQKGEAGHDLNYAARAGVLGMMARPAPLPVQVADLCGGAWPAALQITAALFGRNRSGQGAVIDVSMTDAVSSMLIMPLAQAAAGEERVGGGNDWLVGAVPCYDVYPTKEGHLAVAALEPKFWFKLVDALGLEHLRALGLSRGEEGARCRDALRAALAEKTAAEWEEFFAPHDCCVCAVRDPVEVFRAQVDAGAPSAVSVDVEGETRALPAPPLSLAAGRPTAAAPAQGAADYRLWDDEDAA